MSSELCAFELDGKCHSVSKLHTRGTPLTGAKLLITKTMYFHIYLEFCPAVFAKRIYIKNSYFVLEVTKRFKMCKIILKFSVEYCILGLRCHLVPLTKM